MIEGESFLVLGEGWGHYPSTTEHLLRRLVPRNKFLWVDAIGCSAPEWNLYSLQRAWGKVVEWAAPNGRSHGTDGVAVYSPPVLPLRPISPVRSWNRSVTVRGITRRMRELDIVEPILFTTSPIAAEVMRDISVKLIVYYILDHYEEMPNHYRAYVRDLEAQMMERADIVFATSQPLVEKKSRLGHPVILLPQGVDFEHFHAPVRDGTPAPDDLQNIPGPRILFMGLLAPWVDVDLLLKVARAYPKASLVLIGPARTDVEELRKEPNTFFLGQRAYGDLPRYLAHCDAGLIPFRENTLTHYVNPLKLLEYMAAGLPVISTALPHLAAFADLVYFGRTPEEFVDQVGRALAEVSPHRRLRCVAAAQENSWDRRAEQLSGYLQKSLQAGLAQPQRVSHASRL